MVASLFPPATCRRPTAALPAAYTEAVHAHTTRHGASDEAQALLQQVAQVVHARLPPSHRAVLFGSRATGAAAPRSDWDIGIIGPAPLDGAERQAL